MQMDPVMRFELEVRRRQLGPQELWLWKQLDRYFPALLKLRSGEDTDEDNFAFDTAQRALVEREQDWFVKEHLQPIALEIEGNERQVKALLDLIRAKASDEESNGNGQQSKAS